MNNTGKAEQTLSRWIVSATWIGVSWGCIYCIATAGIMYVLTRNLSVGICTMKYGLIFLPMVGSLLGALRGAIMWRIENGYNAFYWGRRNTCIGMHGE